MNRFRAIVLAFVGLLALSSAASARVLLVGTYKGIHGQYKSLEAAVRAAKPGDWILIGPGDYKTTSSERPASRSDLPAAVLITKHNLHIRGMNRNTVIIDGTKPGTAKCSASKSAQSFGPSSKNGPLGLNGILIFKADDVWVQNLTTCNFLTGSGDAGNGVWWNGGDGSYKIGGWGYKGSYLTATSTYYETEATAAAYGIFSSNWSGGTWSHDYTSNFNDSGFYIGACQNQCDQTINDVWSEFNALGYSGSNSGGRLVVEHSQFDNNEDGFDTNSQNGDEPSPQDGACPGNGISPITHTHSCWVFMDNYVHNNNNPNIPSAGFAAAGPVGTGLSLSGARDDTVMHNVFAHNDAWGTIIVPFPDSGPPCIGGTLGTAFAPCLFDPWGDAILGNTYIDDGGFHNPTNGDIALTNAEPGPTDCFSGNADKSGTLTITPSYAEQLYPVCNGQTVPPSDTNPQSAVFTEEVACDSQIVLPGNTTPPCSPTDHYPRRTRVVMHPLPKNLATMPNPCAGVPANPWCRASAAKSGKRKAAKSGKKRPSIKVGNPSFTG